MVLMSGSGNGDDDDDVNHYVVDDMAEKWCYVPSTVVFSFDEFLLVFYDIL